MVELGKRRAAVVLAIVLAIECTMMVHWMLLKTNCHIDELYSFQYAHCFTEVDEFTYLTEGDLWQDEAWTRAEPLREQLKLTEETSVFRDVSGSLVRLVTGRSYNGLLNAVESLYSMGSYDPLPAIVLNIVLEVITLVVLYSLMRRVGSSQAASIIAVMLYGSSGIVMGHVIFVRFYVWANLLVLLTLYLHAVMWDCDSAPKNLLMEATSLALLYLAMNNSQLVVIICLPLAVGFSCALLARKRISQFLYYAIPVFAIGVWYVVTQTDFLRVIFNPTIYADGTIFRGNVRKWVSINLLSATPETIIEHLEGYAEMLELYLFGEAGVEVALALGGAALLAVALARGIAALLEKRRMANDTLPEEDGLPEGEPEEATASRSRGFVAVLLLVLAFYLLAAALAGLYIPRYLSFAFPIVTIVVVTVLDLLSEKARVPYIATAFFLLVTLFGMSVSFSPEHVEYLYPEDAEFLEELEHYQDDAIILVFCNGNRHPVYDCVSLCQDDTDLYLVSDQRHRVDTSTMPDEVLLWIRRGGDPSPYAEDLVADGYEVSLLASDHASDVYVCRKTEHAGDEG